MWVVQTRQLAAVGVVFYVQDLKHKQAVGGSRGHISYQATTPLLPPPLTPRPHSPTTHPPIHPHQATHRVVDRVRLLKPLNPGSINSATEYLRYQVYLTPEPPNPLSP